MQTAVRPSSVPIGRLIATLAMLAAFGPLSTDMYLAGFGQMTHSFATDASHVQSTLSAFFLGLALGQAIYGPLSDGIGRRPPLLAGILIYTAATWACTLTTNLALFTGLRVIQALGGCVGMVIGRAIVRDLYDTTECARVFSLLLIVSTLAPIAAPMLGGLILSVAGWRAIFVCMLVFGLACGLVTWLVIPETLPPARRQAINVRAVLVTYASLCRRPAFLVPSLVGGLALACMYAFITGSPFVFMNLHGVSAQRFGALFGLNAAGLIIAAQINRFAVRRLRPDAILGAALLLNAIAGLCLAAAGSASLLLFMLPLWFAIASLGFIAANAAAIAMAASGEHAGSASGMIGVVQFCCAFLASAAVAKAQNGTAYPMAIAIATAGSAAMLLWFSTSGMRQREVATCRAG